MTEHTDTDYARARTIIITLKEANLLNTPDFMVTEKNTCISGTLC